MTTAPQDDNKPTSAHQALNKLADLYFRMFVQLSRTRRHGDLTDSQQLKQLELASDRLTRQHVSVFGSTKKYVSATKAALYIGYGRYLMEIARAQGKPIPEERLPRSPEITKLHAHRNGDEPGAGDLGIYLDTRISQVTQFPGRDVETAVARLAIEELVSLVKNFAARDMVSNLPANNAIRRLLETTAQNDHLIEIDANVVRGMAKYTLKALEGLGDNACQRAASELTGEQQSRTLS